jgi:hypothetical protein
MDTSTIEPAPPSGSHFQGLDFAMLDSEGYSTPSLVYNHDSVPQVDGNTPAMEPDTPPDEEPRKPVTVTIALHNPDSETMQSLMKFAMDKGAQFCIKRV